MSLTIFFRNLWSAVDISHKESDYFVRSQIKKEIVKKPPLKMKLITYFAMKYHQKQPIQNNKKKH